MLYPSFYEGFGIPILEAWKAKTAVLASNFSAIPEIAGDAAILIDSDSPRVWAKKMQQILENDSLRKELIENGSKRLNIFSWDTSASLVWNEIENLLNKKSNK